MAEQAVVRRYAVVRTGSDRYEWIGRPCALFIPTIAAAASALHERILCMQLAGELTGDLLTCDVDVDVIKRGGADALQAHYAKMLDDANAARRER